MTTTEKAREGKGNLFQNLKKKDPKHSDFSGDVLIDGYAYWMNGWVKKDRNGVKYISLTFKGKPTNDYAGDPPRPLKDDDAEGLL